MVVDATGDREDTGLLLLGDSPMGSLNSPILGALREAGVEKPDDVLHPGNLTRTRYLIGYVSMRTTMPLGPSEPCSRCHDILSRVFRSDEIGH